VTKSFFLYINLLMALFLSQPMLQAREKTFVVVIDAGHGGKDPGARGTIIDEKAINLSVALKLGERISAAHSDVKIIYTRKTDRFIELDERANIANRNKADLFISIHTNAVKRGSSVRGTETYSLGLARTDENLEVAMRENSAILLEDNYEQTYEGFDPNSSESYIIFEFMQNKHMEQSVGFASEIQKSFVSVGRQDRGVRQAGFLVLRKTSMPSVLVELGYISNRDEERFMKSSEGQNKLVSALADAFTKYKKRYDRGGLSGEVASKRVETSSANVPSQEKPVVAEEEIVDTEKDVDTSSASEVVYKVQILTSDKKLSKNAKVFKGYKNVDCFVEKGIYKYTYGETTDFNSIKKLRRKVAKDFKDAFIVAFKDGKKVKY
jgi:N-acetylmuramoyl-L-alanine amidase